MFEFADNMLGSQNTDYDLNYTRSDAKHIKKMFFRVNHDLSSFLRHLNTLYHSYGINFDASQYHNVIHRIICPYELLTHFKIKNINELINFKYLQYLDKQGRRQASVHHQQNFNLNRKKNKTAFYLEKNVPRDDLKNQSLYIKSWKDNQKQQTKNDKQKDSLKESQFQQDQNYQQNSIYKLEQSKNQYRVNYGARPILEPEQEVRVQKFIIQQVEKGRSLSMQQIADEAKKISQRKKNLTNFLASIGWVRNFMRRYPKMRQLYMKSKQNRQKSRPQRKHPQKRFHQKTNEIGGFYFRANNQQNKEDFEHNKDNKLKLESKIIQGEKHNNNIRSIVSGKQQEDEYNSQEDGSYDIQYEDYQQEQNKIRK